MYHFFLVSCSKPPDNPQPGTQPIIPVIPTTPSIINYTWECNINGVLYKGSVDTGFVTYNGGDTMVSCTGTSLDKTGNIYIGININRRSTRKSTFSTLPGAALFVFDTSYSATYKASYNSGSEIVYQIDTLAGGKLVASFSGTIKNNDYPAAILNVTGGKFSCEFGQGTNEPKFFSFGKDDLLIPGYIGTASLITNTLILDCIPFGFDATARFRLMVRTGGTIKPGTYKSGDGDAGLQYYTPSYYPLYITDDMGNLSVTILSVFGNIVTGTFEGTNSDGKQVRNGRFICRVKNYYPQQDSANKWKFSFDENSFFLYTLYGGNIINATKSQRGNLDVLTINGESDNGDSKFKIVLSSVSPFAPGIYRSGYFSNRVDSLYFRSNRKLWNGNTTYLYSENNSDTYVRIDTIDSKKVVGALLGNIRVFFSTAGSSGSLIRKGSFRAEF